MCEALASLMHFISSPLFPASKMCDAAHHFYVRSHLTTQINICRAICTKTRCGLRRVHGANWRMFTPDTQL